MADPFSSVVSLFEDKVAIVQARKLELDNEIQGLEARHQEAKKNLEVTNGLLEKAQEELGSFKLKRSEIESESADRIAVEQQKLTEAISVHEDRENAVTSKESDLVDREAQIARSQESLDAREKDLESRLSDLKNQEEGIANDLEIVAARNEAANKKELDAESKKQEYQKMVDEFSSKENFIAEREIAVAKREAAVEKSASNEASRLNDIAFKDENLKKKIKRMESAMAITNSYLDNIQTQLKDVKTGWGAKQVDMEVLAETIRKEAADFMGKFAAGLSPEA